MAQHLLYDLPFLREVMKTILQTNVELRMVIKSIFHLKFNHVPISNNLFHWSSSKLIKKEILEEIIRTGKRFHLNLYRPCPAPLKNLHIRGATYIISAFDWCLRVKLNCLLFVLQQLTNLISSGIFIIDLHFRLSFHFTCFF